MAVISPGPLAAGIRGSIGGTTFAPAGSRTVVRAKPARRRLHTQRALAAKARSSAAASAWRSLSASDALGWRHASRLYPQTDTLGNLFYLTGYQLYCKFMSYPSGLQASMIIPAGRTAPPVQTLSLTFTQSTSHFYSYLTYVPAATGRLLFYGSRAFSGSDSRMRTPWTYLTKSNSFYGTINLHYYLNAALGSIPTGETCFVRVIVFLNGSMPSFPVEASTVVVA